MGWLVELSLVELNAGTSILSHRITKKEIRQVLTVGVSNM